MKKLTTIKSKYGVILNFLTVFSIIACSTYQKSLTQSSAQIMSWPPPPTSAEADLPPDIFISAKSLMDVNRTLTKALDKNGYSDLTYFPIPPSDKNGFILVTRMEQINDDATSKDESERWNTQMNGDNVSLGNNFKAVPSSNKKYFRVIAFVVTNVPLQQSDEMSNRIPESIWLDKETDKIPASIGQEPYTRDFAVTALIYEFVQEENSDTAKLEFPSKHSGQTHLKRAKIWNALGFYEVPDQVSATKNYEIPGFPWPPPKASATYVLDASAFSNAKYLKNVNQKLSRALDVNDYSRKSYFSVPSSANYGFALVTQLEQINEDATSKDNTERWKTTLGSDEFSFANYLKAIFAVEKGYFRVIVFVVTDIPFQQSLKEVERKDALGWLTEGTNVLPKEIGENPFTTDYTVTALIYEYELEENQKRAKLEEPSKHTGFEHLKRSKIYKEINKSTD